MKRALITTTINVPDNLIEWAAQLDSDDVIVVAGDEKTPHTDVMQLLDTLKCHTVYIGGVTDWCVDSVIGMNSIQRRNLALLESLKWHPDYVITVDDDNYPSDAWVASVDLIFRGLGTEAGYVQTDSRWFNAGSLCVPAVVHRGYPLDRHVTDRQHADLTSIRVGSQPNVGVFASLWTGAADVDAISRITLGDVVSYVWDDAVLAPGTWCPFNSQATAFRRELAPLMFMLPGVGRYDDIWASFIARTVMDATNWLIRYGEPTVHQRRNPHDNLRDLQAEIFGMWKSSDVVRLLRDVSQLLDPKFSIIECLSQIYGELMRLDWMPRQTVEGMHAWLRDLTALTTHYDVSFAPRELTT